MNFKILPKSTGNVSEIYPETTVILRIDIKNLKTFQRLTVTEHKIEEKANLVTEINSASAKRLWRDKISASTQIPRPNNHLSVQTNTKYIYIYINVFQRRHISIDNRL